jgi:sulfatase modifying factor 1
LSNEIRNISHQQIKSLDPPGEVPHPDMPWIPGGTFCMGSEDFYPDEAPIHTVRVDDFQMDRKQITNTKF